MRTKLSFVFTIGLIVNIFSQAIVNFSDNAFKSKLVFSAPSMHIAKNSAGNWIKVDTNNDMEIQVTEAQQVAELWLLGSNISSLNGIQHFSNLKVLEIGSNNLTNLDLSQNTQLKTVFCDNNSLTNLIVNQNLLLEYLSCSWNNLATINLPSSTAFQKIYCTKYQI